MYHDLFFTLTVVLPASDIPADQHTALEITGRGDVLEPADGIIGIGSGSPYAIGVVSTTDICFSISGIVGVGCDLFSHCRFRMSM